MLELEITEALVEHVRKYLGESGAKFFADVMADHGRYNAVYSVNVGRGRPIPHSVHFREGMQVRNAMRGHADCEEWTAQDLDNTWVRVIEVCLSSKPPPFPVVVERKP